jgi:hypothetical protein
MLFRWDNPGSSFNYRVRVTDLEAPETDNSRVWDDWRGIDQDEGESRFKEECDRIQGLVDAGRVAKGLTKVEFTYADGRVIEGVTL